MGRTGTASYFSDTYQEARQRFIEAAQRRGARLSQLTLQARSPEGEPLSIDIAQIGSATPARAIIHSSGLHGAEGFAGSAIQLALLGSEFVLPGDGALVLAHVLNPYGMAWLRRANEHNVDLNRNFFDFTREKPRPSATYRLLHPLLNPASPPAADLFYLRMLYFALRYGAQRLKQGIAEGQFEYAKGLFYGGEWREEGPALYQQWLRENLSSVQCGFAIDVHTALGKFGQESLFLRRTSGNANRLEGWAGQPFQYNDTAEYIGYTVQGGYASCFDVLPAADSMISVTQEFGTYPALRTLHALREENRWHHYGDGALMHPVKTRFKEMMAPASTDWRARIVANGLSFVQQAGEYLFARPCP